MLYENLTFASTNPIYFSNIFDFSTAIKDYKYISGFLLLYNEFLRLLRNENYININNYTFIDCFNIEEIYDNLYELENLELFSLYSKNITIKSINNDLSNLIKYIDSFSRCLSLAHLSEFDNNSLIDIFKKKASSQETTELEKQTKVDTLGLSEIGFDINNYTPPTKEQKEQIKTMIEIILKDNKKDI